jgi:hypothetical protein
MCRGAIAMIRGEDNGEFSFTSWTPDEKNVRDVGLGSIGSIAGSGSALGVF